MKISLKLFIVTLIGMMSLLYAAGSAYGQIKQTKATKAGMHFFPELGIKGDTLFAFKNQKIPKNAYYLGEGDPTYWITQEGLWESNVYDPVIQAGYIILQPSKLCHMVVFNDSPYFEFNVGHAVWYVKLLQEQDIKILGPTRKNLRIAKKNRKRLEQ